MSEHVVFRQTIPVAMLTAARVVAPALIALGALRGLALLYGVEFDVPFRVLAVLVMCLGVLLLRPSGSPGDELHAGRIPLGFEMSLRWVLLIVVLLLIGYVTKLSAEFSRRVIMTWLVCTPILLVLAATVVDRLLRRAMFSASTPRRVAIAGYNETSRSLAAGLRRRPELSMTLVGYFDDRSSERLGMQQDEKLVGGLGELATFVKDRNIDVLFVALPMRHIQRVLNLLDDLRDTTCSIYYVPDVFVFDLVSPHRGDRRHTRRSDGAGPLLRLPRRHQASHRRRHGLGAGGRVLAAAAGLALLVKFTSKGPVFPPASLRSGQPGDRRLQVPDDDRGRGRRDDPTGDRDDERITPLGRILRRYSHSDRTPAAVQRPAGPHEPGGAAPACRCPQRAVPEAHQGLRGPTQVHRGIHRTRPSERLPWRDARRGGDEGADRLRPRLSAALVACTGSEDPPSYGTAAVQRYEGLLSVISGRCTPCRGRTDGAARAGRTPCPVLHLKSCDRSAFSGPSGFLQPPGRGNSSRNW
ncbi:MAG: hypothetical protein U1F14_15665 [Steroidobacteraceae bacterium]